MAIYALSLVKNEADIIAQNLEAASRWADGIFVLDNGSTDGTWELVQDMARRNQVIVPFRQDCQPFRDGMRGDLLRAYRRHARRGDWWCILDADEFYVDVDPREFLARVPGRYNAVWLIDYNFRFTDADLAARDLGRHRYDGSEPWVDLLRHYVIDPYSEYRFFRHWWGHRRLPPRGWGPIWPQRIPMRHYRYRSPEQIAARLELRAPLAASGMFLHETGAFWGGDAATTGPESWRGRVVPGASCQVDNSRAMLADPPAWQPPAGIVRPGLVHYCDIRLKRLLSRLSRRRQARREPGPGPARVMPQPAGPQPRVTAIIIVRDGEPFIAEAIRSVLAQEGAEWELLVVDDGSRDRTGEIVSAFARQSPGRIALLHHPGRENRGMSASRNLGAAHARGDYIAFLDADDVWLPGKLAEQVAILDAQPETAMVYGRTQIWHSWRAGGSRPDGFFELGVTPDATYPRGVLFRLLIANRAQTPTTCNAMMRRTALQSVGGFDPRFRHLFEDQILFAKLLLRFPAHVSSACWARYRQHDMSTTASFQDPSLVDRAHVRYLAALSAHVLRSGEGRLADIRALAGKAGRLVLRMARRRLARSARACLRLFGQPASGGF